ncbi:MAG: hypothetical protein HY540_01025, partial [Deltaproteobacteria bacterium]|nr:hypothetical protein [Deltaproteobacteria bacterium]
MTHLSSTTTLALEEGTLFEQSIPGRRGFRLGKLDVPEFSFPENLARKNSANLPEMTEVDVARHFTRLSQRNYSKDMGLYPLGSCTM